MPAAESDQNESAGWKDHLVQAAAYRKGKERGKVEGGKNDNSPLPVPGPLAGSVLSGSARWAAGSLPLTCRCFHYPDLPHTHF